MRIKKDLRAYLAPRNYVDFARRRCFWLIRQILHLASDVHIAASADISPFSSLSANSGSIRIGDSCIIDRGAVLRNYGGKIQIGAHSTVGPNCVLYSGGDLIIGEGVRIGPLAVIIAGNHRFDERDIAIYLQEMDNHGITIADDVWIGAGAKILDGVHIGHGAVIAAGAVVTRSVDDWNVVGGIPATVIKTRGAIEL